MRFSRYLAAFSVIKALGVSAVPLFAGTIVNETAATKSVVTMISAFSTPSVSIKLATSTIEPIVTPTTNAANLYAGISTPLQPTFGITSITSLSATATPSSNTGALSNAPGGLSTFWQSAFNTLIGFVVKNWDVAIKVHLVPHFAAQVGLGGVVRRPARRQAYNRRRNHHNQHMRHHNMGIQLGNLAPAHLRRNGH